MNDAILGKLTMKTIQNHVMHRHTCI